MALYKFCATFSLIEKASFELNSCIRGLKNPGNYQLFLFSLEIQH